jgi:hypothetical protein
VVVTTLVLVEVVAGVAATDGVVAAGDVAAAVEVLAGTAVVVEDEDVVALTWADAIPQATPRSPVTDSRAVATLVRRAGWRRRTVRRSCVVDVARIVAPSVRWGYFPAPQGSGRHLGEL